MTVLEQPLPPSELDGLAAITRRADIPVIADESCKTAADIPPLVGKVDGINIKLAKCGSLREALRMIAIARAHGLMVMVGCMIESSIAITAAAHFTPLVDIVDLDGAALLANDPFVGASIDAGQVDPSDRARSGRPAEMTDRFALVALPLPLAQPYTYRIPDTLADRVVPGARVVVPVRRRELVGVVTALDAPAPEAASRDVLAAPDPEAAIPPGLLAAGEWVAAYYGAPIGLTLRCMLPAGMWGESRVIAMLVGPAPPGGVAGEVATWLEGKGGEAPVASVARALRRPVWDALDRLARVGAVALRVESPDTDIGAATERLLTLAGEPRTLIERDTLFRRSPRQRALYEALEASGGTAQVRHVVDQLGFREAVVRALVRRGLATITESERVRDPFASLPASPPPGRAHTRTVRRAGGGRIARAGSGLAAVRRDRQREDAGLSRGGPPRARPGPRGDRAGSRDRAHPADGEPAARRLRRSGRRAPQRAFRRRAGRCLAGAPAGRAARGRRGTLRRLRSGRRPRHHRGGRGAREQLQERRSAPVSRA